MAVGGLPGRVWGKEGPSCCNHEAELCGLAAVWIPRSPVTGRRLSSRPRVPGGRGLFPQVSEAGNLPTPWQCAPSLQGAPDCLLLRRAGPARARPKRARLGSPARALPLPTALEAAPILHNPETAPPRGPGDASRSPRSSEGWHSLCSSGSGYGDRVEVKARRGYGWRLLPGPGMSPSPASVCTPPVTGTSLSSKATCRTSVLETTSVNASPGGCSVCLCVPARVPIDDTRVQGYCQRKRIPLQPFPSPVFFPRSPPPSFSRFFSQSRAIHRCGRSVQMCIAYPCGPGPCRALGIRQ